MRFEGAGHLPQARLELDLLPGGRPAAAGPARVQVWTTDYPRLLGEFEVRPDRQHYTFDYAAQGSRLEADLRFTLKVLNPFNDPGHPGGPLGVVVTQVRLTGGPAGGQPVIPSLAVLASVLASLVMIYLALARSGWLIWQAAAGGGLLAVGAGVGLALFRFHLIPSLASLVDTILLAYPLVVLGLRTTSGWLIRRGEAVPRLDLRWLGLIFGLAFVVKATGLNHPAFAPSDHWFRIHQINRFWTQPVDFWQQYYNVSTGTTVTGLEGGSAVLGQWGIQVSLPYSPLFYIFAAPLSLIWPAHNDPRLLAAVNELASWLEVSQVFLIYIIARRAFRPAWAGRAGLIAAGLYGFYPLSFLLFSDGGYNTIFASWLTLLFVALLFDWLRQGEAVINRWRPIISIIGLVFSLAAALLAHTSTLLLLGTQVALTVGLLLLFRPTRPIGKKLALIGLAGGGLAGLLYYGWYIPGLVLTTLPTFLSHLGSGIGQDSRLLGSHLLTGFWPQLWEHFRLWPFFLTLGAAGWLFGKPSQKPAELPGLKEEISHSRLTTQNIVLLAWLITFGIFSLLDLKVNLLQKHMLFVAPLLCLGSGVALSVGWDWAKGRSQPRRLYWLAGAAIALLIVFNFGQGLLVWYGRVYFLVYPPGSG